MKNIKEYIIESQEIMRIGSDNLYKTGLKYEEKYYTYEPDKFVEEFSKAWYPGEGEYMGAYYIVNFCKKNYNVKIYRATIIHNYGRNSHFQIAWLPMDSKLRTVIPEKPTEEITEYRTYGGFHGSEKNISWVGHKIQSRKDFAEIVYNYIKSIFDK